MTVRPTGLGPYDLLTLEEAAAYVGVRRERAAAWLEERGLGLPEAPGARRYVVLDLVAAMRGAPPEPAPVVTPARRGGTLRRASLERR